MREVKTSYFSFAMNQSLANSDYFRLQKLDSEKHAALERMSLTSNQEREAIEGNDRMDFATYLQRVNNH